MRTDEERMLLDLLNSGALTFFCKGGWFCGIIALTRNQSLKEGVQRHGKERRSF